MSQAEESMRRAEERANRQSNMMGQTTMVSPLARLMTQSIRGTTDEAKVEAKRFVQSSLAKSDYCVVFSKTSCPRCADAVSLLKTITPSETNITVIQLDTEFPHEDSNAIAVSAQHCTSMAAVQDELWDLTGCRTVPRIFHRTSCWGGYDDILELHSSGKLRSLFSSSPMSAVKYLDSSVSTNRNSMMVTLNVTLQSYAATDETVNDDVAIAASSKDGAECQSQSHLAASSGRATTSISVVVSAAMTGLMVKSAVMADLELAGGFGQWVMTVMTMPTPVTSVSNNIATGGGGIIAISPERRDEEQMMGVPFPSRKPISATLPEGACTALVHIRALRAGESSPVGFT